MACIQSHTRFPGYWRLLDVIYLPDENEDEDDENDDMRLDIDNMSYEVTQRFQKKNIYYA